MRNAILSVLLIAGGCSHPYEKQDRGLNSEWFVFVSEDLSEAVHERFADELPIFVAQYARPGDVIHVCDGIGLVEFTLRLPAPGSEPSQDLEREIKEATGYFLSGVHLEGEEQCRLDLDRIEWRMERLRETNCRHPVILLGNERPHRLHDYGCECDNKPHSLLKELFAGRFHPEYRVPTKKMIDFKKNYNY